MEESRFATTEREAIEPFLKFFNSSFAREVPVKTDKGEKSICMACLAALKMMCQQILQAN